MGVSCLSANVELCSDLLAGHAGIDHFNDLPLAPRKKRKAYCNLGTPGASRATIHIPLDGLDNPVDGGLGAEQLFGESDRAGLDGTNCYRNVAVVGHYSNGSVDRTWCSLWM